MRDPSPVAFLEFLPGKRLLIQVVQAIDDFLKVRIAFGHLLVERSQEPVRPFRHLAFLFP
jgi:hypothetical protein